MDDLAPFIESAKKQNASDQFLVDLLIERGWPRDYVYSAVAAYYEAHGGTALPGRKYRGTSAKEAFFYLLSFFTLAGWTIGLGYVLFTLCNMWIPDVAFPSTEYARNQTLPWAAAWVSVNFPIYLLVMRAILADLHSHPEKIQSGIRSALTYLSLFFTAATMIGDTVSLLSALFKGETTPRFFAKVLVVLIIAGGVFWYYFGSLKPSEEGEDAVA